MSRKLQKVLAIIALGVLVLGLFLFPFYAGFRYGERRTFDRFNPHTDTLYIPHDTTITETVCIERWHVRHDTVRLASVDTIYKTDSVLVEVPIEQKVYSDSLYTAWVSGFRPELDSIRLTMPTVYITTTVKVPSEKAGHFGFGVTAGPSVLYNGNTHAGIGATIGINYRF